MIDYLEILIRAVICIAVVIGLTRLNGLRSFSKMSSFDFAITVASGSVLAGTIMAPDKDIFIGLIALASLFIVQMVISRIRAKSDAFQGLTDNTPLLIMENGKVLLENLSAASMTVEDLYGKLREANALKIENIRAVVFESTGDVSVLHGDDAEVSPVLLEGVRR